MALAAAATGMGLDRIWLFWAVATAEGADPLDVTMEEEDAEAETAEEEDAAEPDLASSLAERDCASARALRPWLFRMCTLKRLCSSMLMTLLQSSSVTSMRDVCNRSSWSTVLPSLFTEFTLNGPNLTGTASKYACRVRR